MSSLFLSMACAEPKYFYLQYIARARQNGTTLLQYSCPRCQKVIETPAAPSGDVWDTMATCPNCNGLYLKVVTDTTVETYIPPEE